MSRSADPARNNMHCCEAGHRLRRSVIAEKLLFDRPHALTASKITIPSRGRTAVSHHGNEAGVANKKYRNLARGRAYTSATAPQR
jgi:hypothetical protein